MKTKEIKKYELKLFYAKTGANSLSFKFNTENTTRSGIIKTGKSFFSTLESFFSEKKSLVMLPDESIIKLSIEEIKLEIELMKKDATIISA